MTKTKKARHYTEKRNDVGELCTLVHARIVPLGQHFANRPLCQNFTSAVCAYYYIDTECYNTFGQTTIKCRQSQYIFLTYRAYKATGLHRPVRQRNVNNQFIKTKALIGQEQVWQAVSRRKIAPEAIGRGNARVSRRNK